MGKATEKAVLAHVKSKWNVFQPTKAIQCFYHRLFACMNVNLCMTHLATLNLQNLFGPRVLSCTSSRLIKVLVNCTSAIPSKDQKSKEKKAPAKRLCKGAQTLCSHFAAVGRSDSHRNCSNSELRPPRKLEHLNHACGGLSCFSIVLLIREVQRQELRGLAVHAHRAQDERIAA